MNKQIIKTTLQGVICLLAALRVSTVRVTVLAV
jgi:hypothetical protein